MGKRFVSLLAALALAGTGALAGTTPAQGIAPDYGLPITAPANGNEAGKGAPGLPTVTPAGVKLAPVKKNSTPPKQDTSKGFPESGVSASLSGCVSPTCHSYAGSSMTGLTDDSDGIGGNITVSKPYKLSTEDGHSLTEFAATDGSGNTVEVGWRVDEDDYATNNPYLFTYRWDNGVPQGYDTTGGLQNVAGCNPCAGSSLSAAVNTNKQFGIQYFTNAVCGCTEGWWISYNSTYVGVYPATLWTSPAFSAADRVDAFGEVASNTYSDSCTDMGSGTLGGGGASTILGNLTLPGSTDTPDFNNAGNMYETVAAAWHVVGTSTTSVRTGGPGYNSIGGTPGAIGSCAPSSAGTPPASTFQPWSEFCPDGQTSTGCNGALSGYTTATAGLNVCIALPVAQYAVTVAHNNSGVSGRSYVYYAQSNCGGATTLTIGNAGQGNPSFEPHGLKRIG